MKKKIQIFSKSAQIEIVKMIADLGVGHLGGSLSCTDVLAVLYGKHLRHNPKDPSWDGRDYFVMSKGHCGPALYATLALRGFFSLEELTTLNRPHTNLPSHCDRLKTPGIDMSCGSLGQGCSAAAGMALALQKDHKENDVYVLMGDGEIQEGQVWEAALFAAQQKLDHLYAFVDNNRLQLDGFTDDICSLGDIAGKFREFGWFAQTVNGHDVQAIDEAIELAKEQKGRPSMIVLNTIKGKGWSKSENQINSHSRGFTKAEEQEAIAEIRAEMNKIMEGE